MAEQLILSGCWHGKTFRMSLGTLWYVAPQERIYWDAASWLVKRWRT